MPDLEFQHLTESKVCAFKLTVAIRLMKNMPIHQNITFVKTRDISYRQLRITNGQHLKTTSAIRVFQLNHTRFVLFAFITNCTMNGVKMFMKSYENSYNSDPIHVVSNYSFQKNCDIIRLRPHCELILYFLIIANHIRVLEYLDYIGQLIDISMSSNQI